MFKTSLSSLAVISICCKTQEWTESQVWCLLRQHKTFGIWLLPPLPLAWPIPVPPHHTHTPPSAQWLPSTHVPRDLLENRQELLVLLALFPSRSRSRLIRHGSKIHTWELNLKCEKPKNLITSGFYILHKSCRFYLDSLSLKIRVKWSTEK